MSSTHSARYDPAVPKSVQIRNVPEDVVAILKSRAAASGLSLSDLLRIELVRLAGRPTREELRRRIAEREPVGELTETPVDIVRRMRDALE